MEPEVTFPRQLKVEPLAGVAHPLTASFLCLLRLFGSIITSKQALFIVFRPERHSEQTAVYSGCAMVRDK